jgi:1-acyl-sn-glycerol-3-phosphate acyltransferase
VTRDDITAAVLARDDVARYLRGEDGGADANARRRIEQYLGELRTTQRYRFYRALQHPLYPILRKVERISEHVEHAVAATQQGHVAYISNHKSHLDYLVDGMVLEDHDIRPPLMVAGINLFGGPLGLINRHVTGAIPLRRGSKDPIYLATFRAYVAEMLKRRDVLFYPEGGRTYTGALQTFKTGLLQAALQADRRALSIVPMAIAYDLVLEAPSLARQATRRRIRPFSQELGEMARQAVGFKTRAFVTFGPSIPLAGYDPESRRDLIALKNELRETIGRLYKVLPTALVASAMAPHATRSELASRIDAMLAQLREAGANVSVRSGRQAVEEGLERLVGGGVLVTERQRLRVRDRIVLRYYARTIEHLLTPGRRTVH